MHMIILVKNMYCFISYDSESENGILIQYNSESSSLLHYAAL